MKKIGRELGVRYVLEGSVQRGGNRMRVNVQLIDAESGAHLWAERFDKPVADLFDMQDEIVARLAGTLSAQLIAAEARRAERRCTPDAMDLYFQGMAASTAGDPGTHGAGERLFRACPRARSRQRRGAGRRGFRRRRWRLLSAVTGRSVSPRPRRPRPRRCRSRPNHALAHMILGTVQIFTNRAFRGIAQCEQALALDRNLAVAHELDRLGQVHSAAARRRRRQSSRRSASRRAISSPFAG